MSLAGDVQLDSSSRLTVDSLGGTLTVKEAQFADAGDYICVAVNAAGSSSGKFSLDVGGESSVMTRTKVFLFLTQKQNVARLGKL